jgi:hypothetical protein
MKGRLGEAPLAEPEVTFAGQQPVAEQRAEYAIEVAFDEVALLRDQDFLDVARVIENDDPPSTEVQLDVVALRTRALQQKPELVQTDLGHIDQQEVPAGSSSDGRCGGSHAMIVYAR